MNAVLSDLHHASGGLWPYLVVIVVGFLPSEIWRWLSVFLVKGLADDAEILVWVRAVATALLAGVAAKLLLAPSGALAIVPGFWRGAALGVGFLAFMAFRRSIFAGVIVGEIVLVGAGFMAMGE